MLYDQFDAVMLFENSSSKKGPEKSSAERTGHIPK